MDGPLERFREMMMAQKNYELLSRAWSFKDPPSEIAVFWRQDDARLAPYPDCASLAERIRTKTFFPILQHLGYHAFPKPEVRAEVDVGVDLAVHYFDDAWWRPEQMDRYDFSEEDLTFMKDFNRKALDKSNPERRLEWLKAFTYGLFLGGLSRRWDDLAKIGSWFDATIEPEFQAGMLEDEYMLLFVCIAGSLAPTPMQGADELLAQVKKCRTKRPRLLCSAWEAVNAADQAAFDKAFPATVKHFLSKPGEGQVCDWVAVDQSSVWLIAEHRGLRLPPLSDKERAAVVTRESAGLVP